MTPSDPLPIPANGLNPAAGLSTYPAPPREKYTNILGIFCKETFPKSHQSNQERLSLYNYKAYYLRLSSYYKILFHPPLHKAKPEISINLSVGFSCSCSGGNVCSLTRDALQQNSFVFYCRPKETSKFRFGKNVFLFLVINVLFAGFLAEGRTEQRGYKMFSFRENIPIKVVSFILKVYDFKSRMIKNINHLLLYHNNVKSTGLHNF